MARQSIAQIIGCPERGYDVDTLRAWLAEQDCSVWAGEDADTPLLLSGQGVRLCVVTDRSTEFEADTMLAALEMAVRIVAGET